MLPEQNNYSCKMLTKQKAKRTCIHMACTYLYMRKGNALNVNQLDIPCTVLITKFIQLRGSCDISEKLVHLQIIIQRVRRKWYTIRQTFHSIGHENPIARKRVMEMDNNERTTERYFNSTYNNAILFLLYFRSV